VASGTWSGRGDLLAAALAPWAGPDGVPPATAHRAADAPGP
jgi:hypothetical protein